MTESSEKAKAIENYERALVDLLAHVRGVTVGHNLFVLQSRLYDADIEIVRHDLRDTKAYQDAVLKADRRACLSAHERSQLSPSRSLNGWGFSLTRAYSSAWAAKLFAQGDQQRVVERVDDAGQCRSTFLAGEDVALETACVDEGMLAAAEREVGAAARTRDRLSAVRFAGLGPARDDAVVAHRCIANCVEFPGGEF
jgi:hypothetical protein